MSKYSSVYDFTDLFSIYLLNISDILGSVLGTTNKMMNKKDKDEAYDLGRGMIIGYDQQWLRWGRACENKRGEKAKGRALRAKVACESL